MNYKLLGNSGLRVSELCLGTMTFGTEWGFGSDYAQSKAVFDVFSDAGGNFVDTANLYTVGTSEKWLGEFIRTNRDFYVVATKFGLKEKAGDPNFSGNHRKNLIRSVEGSLKRLSTDYIDLLWLHAWDFTTSSDELMRSLDDLIRSGKVHYIGISNTPAWVIAQSNTLAELRGWNKFAAVQVEYNLLERTAERELIPMARAFDLAITPWSPLAGGALTGKYLRNEPGRIKENHVRRNDRSNAIADLISETAGLLEISPAQVAINWIRQQQGIFIPVIGAKTPEQLKDSLGCLNAALPDEIMQQLDDASAIEKGVPHEYLHKPETKEVLFSGTWSALENHRTNKI